MKRVQTIFFNNKFIIPMSLIKCQEERSLIGINQMVLIVSSICNRMTQIIMELRVNLLANMIKIIKIDHNRRFNHKEKDLI